MLPVLGCERAPVSIRSSTRLQRALLYEIDQDIEGGSFLKNFHDNVMIA